MWQDKNTGKWKMNCLSCGIETDAMIQGKFITTGLCGDCDKEKEYIKDNLRR